MRISDWSSDVCSSDLITDQVHVYASFSNGFQTARSLSQVPNDTFTIFRGNPFIPEGLSIGDLASFPLSKFFSDLGGSKIRRSEEHTYELQSLRRISFADSCIKHKHKTKLYLNSHL